MPDFTVPDYSALLNALNDKIATGAPKLDTNFSALIDSYGAGRDLAYKLRNQDAFAGGVPKDFGQILGQSLRVAGTPGIQGAIGLANVDLLRQRIANGMRASEFQATGRFPGDPSSGQFPPSTSNPGLDVFPRAPGGPPPSPPPAVSSKGGPTINTVAGNRLPPELAGPAANSIAAMAGLRPDEPLDTPEKYQRAMAAAQRHFRDGASVGQVQMDMPPDGGQLPAPPGPGGVPYSQPRPVGAPSMGVPAAAPASFGDRFAAAFPQGGAAGPPAIPGQPASPSAGYLSGDPTLGGLVPAGVDPVRYLAGLRRYANGSVDEETRKGIQSHISATEKALIPTGPMKEYNVGRMPGEGLPQYQARVAAEKKRAEDEAAESVKMYRTLQQAGVQSQRDMPQIQLAKRLIEDPAFYSGTAADQNLTLKKILANFGQDPNASAPQEVVGKILAKNLADGLRTTFGGLGQVRVAELNLLQKATESNANTVPALRALTTMTERVHQRNVAIAQMARQYNGGRLDQGFDAKVAEYDQKYPLFTPGEIANYQSIFSKEGPREKQELRDGMTATHPATGQRLIRENGRWVPFT